MFTFFLGILALLNVLQTAKAEVIQYLTTRLDCFSVFLLRQNYGLWQHMS